MSRLTDQRVDQELFISIHRLIMLGFAAGVCCLASLSGSSLDVGSRALDPSLVDCAVVVTSSPAGPPHRASSWVQAWCCKLGTP